MLKKAMYGLQDSPRAFCEWLRTQLEGLGWKYVGWGCFIKDKNGSKDIIVAYVDDLWIWSNKANQICEEISEIVSMDEPKAVSDEWTRYIGIDVRREEQIVETSVQSYTESFEVPEGIKGFIRDSDFPVKDAEEAEVDLTLYNEYTSLIGKLGWVSSNHPGLSYMYGELARHCHKPSKRILDLAYRVCAAIRCKAPSRMKFTGVRGCGEIRVWTDASLRRQGLSGVGRSGYLIQYLSSEEPLSCRDNYVAWGSTVDKRKHPSTSSAEIAALLLGIRESMEVLRAIKALAEGDVDIRVYIDAKVVCEQLKTGKASANPFDQDNVDYVLQCLADLKGLGLSSEPQVIHVGTNCQKADGLTKYLRNVWHEAFWARLIQ